MSTQPTISVVVPTYDAAATIDRCLAALLDQTFPRDDYEIIVVDDGSDDQTCVLVKSYPAVRLVTQAHAGPAVARNLGARHARGDILLFTDSDCAPSREWIERLIAPFDDEQIAGVKGAYLCHQQELVARFVQLEYEAKYDRMSQLEAIDFVDTYSAGYRRHLFLENGGFDPIFPTDSVEDQEFSFRLAHLGHKMVFVPEATVQHLAHPTSVWAYWRRKFAIGYWKVLVTRRYHDKVWRDSHTPQSLKAQILLVGLGPLCLLAALLWLPMSWVSVLVMLLFVVSILPFSLKAWSRDPLAAVVSPLLLLVRALALGTGFAVGLVSQQGAKTEPDKAGENRGTTGSRAILPPPCHSLDHGRGTIAAKRAMDVLGAALGLLFSLPVLGLAAILIKVDSRGPVLFVQDRVGEDGQVFKFFKLRSMVENAESLLDQLIDLDTLDEPVFKLKNDPRVTRVGRFLRRWSIDELPQFLNVLKGDMSLVGPRPEEVRIVRYYEARHRQRLAAKPGITGPVQINGRGDLSLEERVLLEEDYIQSFSLKRDLEILLRTIAAVIRGHGSY